MANSVNRYRQDNFKLIRLVAFNSAQKDFAKILNMNQSEYSQFERGDKDISDHRARTLETELALPSGWMDRDNANLFLDNTEFELIRAMRDQSEVFRNKLLELVRSLPGK